MPSTYPRRDSKDAFKAILDAASLGVPVFRDLPVGQGVPVPSVVLTLVSGGSRTGAIGRQVTPTQRAVEERHRIQVDCYHIDKIECDQVADQVEQAIVDQEEVLRSTYDIEDIQKLDDSDVAPQNVMANECRVRMDFGFITYRAIA